MFAKLKQAACRIKLDALTVYFAARDPMMPTFVRILALVIAAYAFSPIDLIPDFIPVLGYLDDLILLPLGIALVIKLTPASVIELSRKKATEATEKPSNTFAAIIIIGIWLLCALCFSYWLYGALGT